jgi:hypothetical protein
MENLTGGCACDKVRYECRERPLAQLICHCRDCQRASGGVVGALMIVPSDRLTFTRKEPKYYEVRAESGRTMWRGFCGECGSPVSIRRPEATQVEFLYAASLDNPSRFAPSCEVWATRAYPWHHFRSGLLQFDQGPSEEAVRNPIAAYFASRT